MQLDLFRLTHPMVKHGQALGHTLNLVPDPTEPPDRNKERVDVREARVGGQN